MNDVSRVGLALSIVPSSLSSIASDRVVYLPHHELAKVGIVDLTPIRLSKDHELPKGNDFII